MKILHLIYDHKNNPWVGGGGAIRAYNLNKKLAQKGHNILIISGSFNGITDYGENNLSYKFLGFSKNYHLSVFSYCYYAQKFLKKNYKKFDIIIEDYAPWNPIFSYIYQNRLPIILQMHHIEGRNILKKYCFLGLPFYILEKLYYRKFFNIITVSQATKKRLGATQATVVSNGVDKKLLLEKNSLGDYILYLGRIDFYNKGIDLLIKAAYKYKLFIAGKGKDEKKLKKIKGDNVLYLGFLDKAAKIDYIKNSHFLIMPSRFEGQGIVALEAAALGKAIIVSDIPELEYVVDNGFGIAFKSGDAKDLNKKIKYLWNNSRVLLDMGKNARKFAKNYTWEKMADKYEQYLLESYKKFYN